MLISVLETALPVWLMLASSQVAQPRAAIAGVGSVPLTVLTSRVDVARQTVIFTLQNTGATTITGWHVDLVIGTPSGLVVGGYGVDAFREFEGLSVPGPEGVSYLPAGGTVTSTATLPSRVEQADLVDVQPRTAIFADTSFAGEALYARAAFDRRAEELSVWREMTRILQDGRSSGVVDTAKLESLLETIGTVPRAHGDVVRQMVRANLTIAINSVREGRAQPVAALNRLLGEAERNVGAAIAHARR